MQYHILLFRVKGVHYVLKALEQCTAMVDDVEKVVDLPVSDDSTIDELRARNKQIEVFVVHAKCSANVLGLVSIRRTL